MFSKHGGPMSTCEGGKGFFYLPSLPVKEVEDFAGDGFGCFCQWGGVISRPNAVQKKLLRSNHSKKRYRYYYYYYQNLTKSKPKIKNTITVNNSFQSKIIFFTWRLWLNPVLIRWRRRLESDQIGLISRLKNEEGGRYYLGRWGWIFSGWTLFFWMMWVDLFRVDIVFQADEGVFFQGGHYF